MALNNDDLFLVNQGGVSKKLTYEKLKENIDADIAVGGVTKIVAGNNITISPTDGTGVVTITGEAGGGGTIGAIVAWGNNTPPEGWLECNGDPIPAEYTELIALVGANTPDLRGEFVRGWDNGAGVDAGRTLLSSQADELKSHNHRVGRSSTAQQGGGAATPQGDANDNDIFSTSTGGAETRPRNVALMYIINASGSAIGGNGNAGGFWVREGTGADEVLKPLNPDAKVEAANITLLRSRLDALEANEMIDDAVDTSLLSLLASASSRLDSIEARLNALEGGN
jgi:microcystin-dependent protein